MGRLFVVNLEGEVYSCKHCKTHLALSDDIISRCFKGKHGKAYLITEIANVSFGEKEDRMLRTGLHIVADLSCVTCGSIVGWRYEFAHEEGEKYKEGYCLLEKYKISGPDSSNNRTSDDEIHMGDGDTDADDA